MDLTKFESSDIKLVYYYLSDNEYIQIDEMKSDLGLPLTDLYPIIRTLERYDDVIVDGDVIKIKK